MIIIHIGDVVGKLGRLALTRVLPELIDEHSPGFVVVNGENAAGGVGITEDTANVIFEAGADCITTGNHVFSQREAETLVDKDRRVLRPANYPPGTPGSGSVVLPALEAGVEVGVINLCGRVFMRELDCPFRRADEIVGWMREETRVIVVDMHAEATSEKQALAHHLDGRVSAVIGTHTHVQTADERVLPGGTAYLTDAGMTGGTAGIIGVEPEAVLRRFRTQMPARFEPPRSGPAVVAGLLVDVDPETGKAREVRRIRRELHAE